MRINEIANAEEQLALWKLVSDNVWQAINTQAQQQARAKAEKAAQAKAKRGVRGKGGRKRTSIPHVPAPPPLKKPNPIAKPNATPIANKQQTVGGIAQLHTPTQQKTNPHSATALPTQQKLATPTPTSPQVSGGMAQQHATQANPTQQPQVPHMQLTPQQKRLQAQKTGYLGRNSAL
jgi:hypothetical protein